MSSGVSAVYINADAYQVCMDHAFSTEREEVMGLLMGEVRFTITYYCLLELYHVNQILSLKNVLREIEIQGLKFKSCLHAQRTVRFVTDSTISMK